MGKQPDWTARWAQIVDVRSWDRYLQGNPTYLQVHPVGSHGLQDATDANYQPLPLESRRYLPAQGGGGLTLYQMAKPYRQGVRGVGLRGFLQPQGGRHHLLHLLF